MKLHRPLQLWEIERASAMPNGLRQVHARFCAWRLTVKDDFLERLMPRSTGFLAVRLNTSVTKTKALMALLGWEEMPRRASTDTQLWIPPLCETFAEIQTDF